MNAKQFKLQYLWSLGLTVLAVFIFVAAIMMFLYSSGSELTKNLEHAMNNPELMAQVIWNIISHLLLNSVYAILAIVLYWTGVIWNIVVAVRRSNTQNDYSLSIIVIVGWVASILFPIVGFLMSFVTQIWGWFKGGQETTTVITS